MKLSISNTQIEEDVCRLGGLNILLSEMHIRKFGFGRENFFLSSRPVSPFLAWGDFHARSLFARSTIPEEKWGTTRSLQTVSCAVVVSTHLPSLLQ